MGGTGEVSPDGAGERENAEGPSGAWLVTSRGAYFGQCADLQHLGAGAAAAEAEKFQAEFESFKPAARRLLAAHGNPPFHLQVLPTTPAALPVQTFKPKPSDTSWVVL